MDERRAAAYQRLDEVVRELTAITEDESDDGQPRYTATDYVLIVGAQTIDNDGDRVGYVTVYPQGGSQTVVHHHRSCRPGPRIPRGLAR